MSRLCFLLLLLGAVAGNDDALQRFLRLPSDHAAAAAGTRWAILIAGSNGYSNYRHQADICHAYQILKRGGLKDSNIVVFMYDDIANHPENPHPGVIINHPKGVHNVYTGVPKDYTGRDVTASNFLAALLGDTSKLTGNGTGKVIASGPDDHVFVYYADHGGPGVLGMPDEDEYLYADVLVKTLVRKHAGGKGYKSLVFYLEACESGSIFEGVLPGDISVYATTAANAVESSWGTYCPGDVGGDAPPVEYDTCLGDLYSVAWMEDSDLRGEEETLEQQYGVVKERTSDNGTYSLGSHVMRYGDVAGLGGNSLDLFIGSSSNHDDTVRRSSKQRSTPVNQRDADLVYFWRRYMRLPDGSPEKLDARRRVVEVMDRRARVDAAVEFIVGVLLPHGHRGDAVRAAGQPLVDDWECVRSMVRRFEERCGKLGQYGMKHMRAMANLCNAGVGEDDMAVAASQACANKIV